MTGRYRRRVPRSRSLVGVLVALLVASAALTGCGDSRSGTARTDPAAGFIALSGAGFRMKLPSRTTRTVRTVPTATGKVTAVLYTTADDPDGTYLVALTAYPTGTVVDLDKAVSGAAKNIGGTVRQNDTAQYRGHDARNGRFTAETNGAPVTVFVRMIDLGGKLFQLQYGAKGADVKKPPAAYDAVAASVRFE
jgi:hypothetical protein